MRISLIVDICRWAGIVFHATPKFPRHLRVLSLTINILVMLFIEAVTYGTFFFQAITTMRNY